MFTNQPFEHSTIRHITIAFGNMFNNIKIKRTDKSGSVSIVAVPLHHGPKEGWFARLSNPLEGDPEVAERHMILPQMTFDLASLDHDPQRQSPAQIRLVRDKTENNKAVRKVQFNRVSYKASFQLYINTNSIEDQTKIVEQILPYFSPSISADVREQKDSDVLTSVKFRLVGYNKQDNWVGDIRDTRRRIVTTLSFEAEFYMYLPITNQKVIKHTFIDVFASMGDGLPTQEGENPDIRAEAIVDPINAFPPDPYTVTELYIDYTIGG